MKTNSALFTSGIGALHSVSKRLLRSFWGVTMLSLGMMNLAGASIRADSGTWDPPEGPITADWNTASNWSSDTVPNGDGQVATFDMAGGPYVSLSANTTIGSIVFTGNNGYVIQTSSNDLSVTGVGIVGAENNDAFFVGPTSQYGGVIGNGELLFYNSASAGSGTNIDDFADGGFTLFNNTSTAGSANIDNRGALAANVGGGGAGFGDSSSAGSASILNEGGGSVQNASGGVTSFTGSATAAQATIMNAAGTGGANAGSTLFSGNASAGTAHFTNAGSGVAGVTGGAVSFSGNATAANGVFTINGGTANGANGGIAYFMDTSTAANGAFTVHGGTVSGALGGIIVFEGTAAAGAATFNVNAGLADGASGATLIFDQNSSAGSATLIANAGTDGQGEAFIDFSGDSSAGTATLIANAGTDGQGAAGIGFGGDSTGGSATVKIYGLLDISQHDSGTVTIGSLEGSGAVSLGANTLSIGQNSATKTFTGVIEDEGLGGSLIKGGSGKLVLGGASTYTGPTTIAGGVLEVDGSLTSDVTINRGATLAGVGSVGNLTLESGGSIAPGSSNSAPFSTLTAKSLLWEGGGVLNFNVFGPISFLSLSGALDTDSEGLGPLVFDLHSVSTPRIGQTVNLIGFTSEDIPIADFVSQADNGLNGVFSYNNDELQFTVESVPEPSTAALALIGLIGLMIVRRKFAR